MEYEIREIRIGGKRLKAEIADTSPKRAKGLSERGKIKRDQCMLFIFPYKAGHALWMRGMKFPIDVLWLDEKKKIVDMRASLKPASGLLDFKMYSPKRQSSYVIELGAGFIKSNKISENTKVLF